METCTARFDDLVAEPHRHLGLADRVADAATAVADRVPALIAAAEHQAAELGRWVVLAVAYEAAVGLDPALRVSARPPAGRHLVQWAAFERAVTLPAPASPPADATLPLPHRHPLPGGFVPGVDEVRRRIAIGDVYQVNLTERFVRTGDDPALTYASLLSGQSCAYGALVEFADATIACASPELFFRWDGATITCRPMKGTARRHPRTAKDIAVAAGLAASEKDRAENVMIVDLLRNDLGRLARTGTVRVPDLFALERYETVWQMTSTIEADVATDTTLVDVFRALFPCGSVTGAPKHAAMDIIAGLEAEPRGVYCGALGILSPPGRGPRAVFCVPIRTAVIDRGGVLTYGAGAGITWGSDPHLEDAEVDAKARILTHPWPAFELLDTLLLDAPGLLHLQQHLDRLADSARWFGIPLDVESLRCRLAALEPTVVPQRVRVLVAHDGDHRVDVTALDDAPAVVRLAIDSEVTRSDDPFSCHKTTAREHYRRALQRHPGSDDVILVNEHGRAVETTTANLAYRRDGTWWVPPLDDGGLPGIGRRVAIEEGRVAERSITAAELAECDELAVINDLRGWRPARFCSDLGRVRGV